MKVVFILALSIAWALASVPFIQKTSLPSLKPEGYLYGEKAKNNQVRLDIYADYLWDDCKKFDPVFRKYISDTKVKQGPVKDLVETYLHIYPLPYHHHAFSASQMAPYIQDLTKNSTQFYEFTEWMIDNQHRYEEQARCLSEAQCQHRIWYEAAKKFSYIDRDHCLKMFQTYRFDNDARISFKYAAAQGITETPAVLLNGIKVDTPTNQEEWQALMKPYIDPDLPEQPKGNHLDYRPHRIQESKIGC